MTIRKEKWKIKPFPYNLFEKRTKWVVLTNDDWGIAFENWENAKIYEKLLQLEEQE